MPTRLATPGVYIEEIRKFPPSIAEVETAIPAFVGHTEKARNKSDNDLLLKPWRIKSLAEYERYFGGPQAETALVVTIDETQDGSGATTGVEVNAEIDAANRSNHIMFYAMQFYFANGGGPCYIVSVGGYGAVGSAIALGDTSSGMLAGLEALKQVDEPTLLVCPESQGMTIANFKAYMDAALAQAADLQDRFVVMDVHDQGSDSSTAASGFRTNGVGIDNLRYGAAYYPNLETVFDYHYDEAGTDVSVNHNINGAPAPGSPMKMADLTDDALINRVKAAITDVECILPPSPGIVGVYGRVDESRGVWKAPANTSLNSVVRPTVPITHDDQESLNIDTTAGKSINAIREFTGRGVLIWGARTLAGNDNEWRYVNVRRFFNMVEESVKKATESFVFEPNDRNTWTLVRSMIENFLQIQWRNGALAGATPEEAYFVRVGLPETMTSLDILEGRMNIEIGMAVVRPAEFIILKFSHMMQTS